MNRRLNTFRVDYSNIPKKPSFEDLHKFIAHSLGLNRDDVERIQCNRTLGCAFVKVKILEVAQRVVDEHDNKHTIRCEDKEYKIHIAMEDGAIDVKLSDLSEAVTNEEITQSLSQYGRVLSIREVMWDEKFFFGGTPTGIRVARMIVERNIASFIKISGETTSVIYQGQLQTCRHCSESAHNGISCVQNKKLVLQKTYADAAKQPQKPPARAQPKTARSTSILSVPPRTDTDNFPKLAPTAQQETKDNRPISNQQQKLLKPMLPPPGPVASRSTRLQTRNAYQTSGGSEMDTNGNETDSSTTSNNSIRGKGVQQNRKKFRTDENDIEQKEKEINI